MIYAHRVALAKIMFEILDEQPLDSDNVFATARQHLVNAVGITEKSAHQYAIVWMVTWSSEDSAEKRAQRACDIVRDLGDPECGQDRGDRAGA